MILDLQFPLHTPQQLHAPEYELHSSVDKEVNCPDKGRIAWYFIIKSDDMTEN